jgi:hypothetical protein
VLGWPTIGTLFLATAALAQEENARWLDYLLPLPHECQLGQTLRPPRGPWLLQLPAARSPLVEQIAAEVAELVGKRVELAVRYELGQPALVLGAAGGGAAQLVQQEAARLAPRLKQLPNSEQAYAVRIQPDGAGWRAVVLALAEPGLYYGHKTLRQLLEATLGERAAAAALCLPRAQILDWPDLPERGEWGGDALAGMPWLAERKMNLVEAHATLSVDEQGHGHATFSADQLALARRHAIKLVPIITHLDQLEGTGIFARHPEVLAKGGPEAWTRWGGELLKPVCFAEPAAIQVLTEWMEDLARIEGVEAITVWLSEAYGQCKCPQCAQTNQYVMETRACLQAWRRARARKPNLQLRILLTQGSYSHNESVLAEIPTDEHVGAIHYHGSLTYTPLRRDMIEPYMVEFVRRGGWLGVCPVLTASWRIVSPFSCPQFIHARMEEFLTKGLQCLYAYATPANAWWDMNVQAAAEWTWNLRGRDVRSFARAWATRRRLAAPAAVAEWVDLVGDVSWDLYASGVPYPWLFGEMGRTLAAHKPLAFASGPFAALPTAEHFDENRRRLQQALDLAVRLGADDLLAETRVLLGYYDLLATLRGMSEVLAACQGRAEALTAEQRAQLTAAMGQLDSMGRALVADLWKWGRAVALQGTDATPPSRFEDTVNSVEETVAEVAGVLEKLGIPDPGRPYRWRKIGAWRTEDFNEQSPLTRRFEVTDRLEGAGTYLVRFVYRSGVLGLRVSKVRLLSAPADRPEELQEEAADAHECHAGAWNRGTLYRLPLAAPAPQRKYFVEITMGAGSPATPPDQRSSNGDIFFAKQRE